MSLDATPVRLTKFGTVTIFPPGAGAGGIQIFFEGFHAEGASCRDTAVLAAVWAIGELQRELMRDIEMPGGGATGVD